ncbi:MAG: CDP-diacylglycerol--serine O-phosphatidyltransferase [Thermodesulfobacteriota bacterium]
MSKKRNKLNRHDLHRGVYVLPNLVTAMNMFFGFYAIIAATQGRFARAAIAVIVAGVFDNLDGKIARAFKSTSRFGVEFDSLSDLVSFGVAPAVLVYLWALQGMGRLGWLAAFVFAACGALRLARFNTQVGSVGIEHFVGLPIPGAAGMAMATVLFYHRVGWYSPGQGGPLHPVVILAMLFTLAFLMVSTVPYESFKKSGVAKRKSFDVLVWMVLLVVAVAVEPYIGLFVVGAVYVSSGPVLLVIRHLRRHARSSEVGDTETTKTPL